MKIWQNDFVFKDIGLHEENFLLQVPYVWDRNLVTKYMLGRQQAHV